MSLDQLSTNSLLCSLRYDSSPGPSSSFSLFSSPVFLLLLSFRLLSFFFCPFSLKVFQEYIGREKEQYKKRTEQKMRKSQSNIKKKETQLREENEQWNAREKRERTWVLRYSGRNRFLREGLSFTCPTCNLISVSE